MGLHEDIRELVDTQRNEDDGYRLFHDGTIKTETVTDSLEVGWYTLARAIPGASLSFRHMFPVGREGIFIKMAGIREAIDLRDRMIDHVVELRVRKQFEMDLRV